MSLPGQAAPVDAFPSQCLSLLLLALLFQSVACLSLTQLFRCYAYHRISSLFHCRSSPINAFPISALRSYSVAMPIMAYRRSSVAPHLFSMRFHCFTIRCDAMPLRFISTLGSAFASPYLFRKLLLFSPPMVLFYHMFISTFATSQKQYPASVSLFASLSMHIYSAVP